MASALAGKHFGQILNSSGNGNGNNFTGFSKALANEWRRQLPAVHSGCRGAGSNLFPDFFGQAPKMAPSTYLPSSHSYILKTAAGHCKWAAVLKDLEQIKTSKDIDVRLYTANTDEDKECQEPVMRCFFLETQVILQECLIKNCSKTQDVRNIWKNGNASLESNKMNSTTSGKCKECEEYEEKNFTEFIQSFVKVIQKECKQ